MDLILTAALVIVGLIAVGVFFFFKYVASKSGGNDDVWKPNEDNHPNPEG